MTEVGSVYGQALYDLARSEGLAKSILDEMAVLRRGFEAETGFIRLLSAPALTKQERCQILDDSFRGRVRPYVLNFMKILTEKGYMRHFSDCCDAYRQHYDEDHGILRVTAVTAVALTAAQREKLRVKLGGITGKTIDLINRVDPSCIGGVRLDCGGKRLDDTVSHRLEAVRSMLKNTVL